MKTKLKLSFCPSVSGLFHKTKLNFITGFNNIANPRVEAVSVKKRHRPVVTNVALAVDKEFVVKR